MTCNDFPDAIRVPPSRKPSYFNREAFNGAIIGSLLTRKNDALGLGIGGAIGGMLGKERMEREQEEGRIVTKPGSWLGSVGGGALFGAAIMGGIAMLIGTPAVLPYVAIGAAVSSILGGISHSASEKDYEIAKTYYAQNGNFGGMEAGRKEAAAQYQMIPIISREEARAMDEKMRKGKHQEAVAEKPCGRER